MEGSCRVLLVPFPINLLTAFAYFLYRKFEVLGDGVLVRYRKSPGGEGEPLYFGNGAVWNLSCRGLFEELGELIRGYADGSDQRLLRRLLTFFRSPDPAKRRRLERWLIECSLALDQPHLVLEEACGYFARCVTEGIDPWKQELPRLPRPQYSPKLQHPAPPDKRIITLPILKSAEPGEREVVDEATFTLYEGRISALQGTCIGIGIGGQKGSGKSTTTASLAVALKNNIASLRSRIGWEDLDLTVEVANLDLATPTVDAIAAGSAKGRRDALRARRQPWTEPLALQALEAFIAAKARANIVLADLPGVISPITEIVAAPADTAIILDKDLSDMREWRDFAVGRMGLEIVSRARSRHSLPEPRPFFTELLRLLRRLVGHPADDGIAFTSMVTLYQPGKMVLGRVVDLDRVTRSRDHYISLLAEFLLYDILPSFVGGRREKLERLRLALS